MASVGSILAAAYAVSGALMLPFAVLFARQDVRGSRVMAAIAVSTFVTAEVYTVSMVVDGLAATLAWYYVFAIAISVSSLLFLVFTLIWTDRTAYLRPGVIGPVAAVQLGVPALGLLAMALPWLDLRSLVWADPGLIAVDTLTVFDRTPGPLGFVWRGVATLSVLAAIGFLAEFTVRPEQRLYRKRNALLLAAPVAVTALATGAQLAGVPLEVTPIAYTLTAGLFAIAIVRFGRFDVVPLASDSIVEELDVGLLVYDTAGRVLDANRRARTVLGIEAPVGRPVGAVLADSSALAGTVDPDADPAALQKRLDGHEFSVTHDGDERRYAVSVSPVTGTGDRRVGRAVLFYDVTERYRRERRLERKNAQLERKNEQLERLAGVISHDMRTPLSAGEKALALLEEDLTDPEPAVERSLEHLEGVHDRLRAFADHLPRLAREGTNVETAVECDLAELAESAWAVAGTDAVTLHIEGTRSLWGDPQRLQQVFENLFANAVRHGADPARAAEGEGVADAAVSEPPPTGGAAAGAAPPADARPVTEVRVGTFASGVFVADDGPGIPPDLGSEVFEYGVSTGEGAGFGLAIVRTIVEAHGWDVVATESEAGGARFEIHIEA